MKMDTIWSMLLEHLGLRKLVLKGLSLGKMEKRIIRRIIISIL